MMNGFEVKKSGLGDGHTQISKPWLIKHDGDTVEAFRTKKEAIMICDWANQQEDFDPNQDIIMAFDRAQRDGARKLAKELIAE